eukprot:jgi/Mesvir1/7089/Mv26522-RA.1
MSKKAASTSSAADNPLYDLKAQLESLVTAQVSAKTSELQERELVISQREKCLEKTLRSNSDRVTFSVGGEKFELAASTLAGLPATWFEGVLSPDFKRTDDGVIFVDRDSESFRVIVDFIRYGVLPELDDPVLLRKLKADADFYSFSSLAKVLKKQSRLTQLSNTSLSCSSSSMAGPSSKYYNWVVTSSSKAAATAGFLVDSSGGIKAVRGGTYLLNVRIPGVSSGNTGYAQLSVDGTTIGQAWSNNGHGYYAMMYFNEVLHLREGAEIKIEACNLSGTAISAAAASLHLTPVNAIGLADPWDGEDSDGDADEKHESDRKVEYIVLDGSSCSGANQPYLWGQSSRSSHSAKGLTCLALLDDKTGVRIKTAGRYLVMARVNGTSSSNNGYADLRKSDTSLAQAWSGDANGYARSLYFNEVLSLAAGDTLKIYNVNLNYAYDKCGSFTVLRLGA